MTENLYCFEHNLGVQTHKTLGYAWDTGLERGLALHNVVLSLGFGGKFKHISGNEIGCTL